MSEVQSRPSAPRGRSSARGGRGGYSSRGPRTSKQLNGHSSAGSIDASTEEGELGELRQQYATQLATIKDTFPDWSDLDLLLALHDSDGDLQLTSEKILEEPPTGQISQFSDVPKKNDRSRSKVKDISVADTATSTAPTRGRGRFESTRGGRGRGAERGRGGFRGRGGAHAPNGSRSGVSVPTTESTAWDTTASAEAKDTLAWDKPAATETKDGAAEGQWNSVVTSEATPATASEGAKKTLLPEGPPKKTWASMFAQPKPAPAPPKPAAAAPPPEPAVPAPAPVPAEPEPEPIKEEAPPAAQVEELPIPPVADEVPAAEPPAPAAEPAVATPDIDLTSAQITPSKEELTEDNVERLPDSSVPAPTGTAASTVASGSVVGVATPLTGPKGTSAARPPLGGFQTSALKATATPGRSSSFQRKVIEQQEAVVMPGNHAVDRAAVQFGSLGLNGEPDLDVDEDREEAETRTQPPQHSPTQQPRTSLPPAPRQPSVPSESQIQESAPTPKQAPGLPPVAQPQQSIAPQQQSPAVGSQAAQPYSQFGRYGQPAIQSEQATQAQKPYDPFGAPVSQPSQFDTFPTSQAQNVPQAQASLGAFSSAPNDYSSYYTSDQQRSAYQNYYGAGYGQQAAASQPEADTAQQRTGSGFGPSAGESAFPPGQSQQAQSRYGEAQTSGHNTPAPTIAGHHSAAQSQHLNQPHGHAGHGAGFPYGHPYYNSPYYANYMSQYGGYAGQGYGGPFGGKNMYGHHGYGMSPATTYDTHAASPANVGGFGTSSIHARDSALGGGLGDYGRTSSSQPSQTQQHTASSGAFGGMPDVFGRNQSVFPGQNQPYGQQQSGSQTGNDEALKPFGEKSASGPSPSSIGQPGRPGSATNNSVGQGGQSGLPPPQSHQQGFGGYPSTQYGLSGLGGHQSGQGYGGYNAFGGAYGGYTGRGGWGGNYGH